MARLELEAVNYSQTILPPEGFIPTFKFKLPVRAIEAWVNITSYDNFNKALAFQDQDPTASELTAFVYNDTPLPHPGPFIRIRTEFPKDPLKTKRGREKVGLKVNPYAYHPEPVTLPWGRQVLDRLTEPKWRILMSLLKNMADGSGLLADELQRTVHGKTCEFGLGGRLFTADLQAISERLRDTEIVHTYDQARGGYETNHRIALRKKAAAPDASWKEYLTQKGYRKDIAEAAEATIEVSGNGHQPEDSLSEAETEPKVRAFDLDYLTPYQKAVVLRRLINYSDKFLDNLSRRISPETFRSLLRRIPPILDDFDDQVRNENNQKIGSKDPKPLTSEDVILINIITPLFYCRKGLLDCYNPRIEASAMGHIIVANYFENFAHLNPTIAFKLLRKELRGETITEEDFEDLFVISDAREIKDPNLSTGSGITPELKQMLDLEQEKIFTGFYEEYEGIIFGYLFYKTNNHMLAEDLTMDVFMNATRAFTEGRYRPLEGIPAQHWLLRIARNRVIDHYKKSKPKEVHLLDPTDNENVVDPSDLVEENEEIRELYEALKKLPDEQQTVLNMRFFDKTPHTEVAQVLGKKPSTTRVIQQRAIQKMKRLLDVDNQS